MVGSRELLGQWTHPYLGRVVTPNPTTPQGQIPALRTLLDLTSCISSSDCSFVSLSISFVCAKCFSLFATPRTAARLQSGSSVHGILQARILEWVAISSSRGSSQPRDQTVSLASPALAGSFFTSSTTWGVQYILYNKPVNKSKNLPEFCEPC